MPRVLIVDDHAVVRSGLRQFLADSGQCRIAGEAGSGAEALKLVDTEVWDVMLLDIGLPDINGLELLKRIKRLRPSLPILVFSMYPDDEYAMAAIEAGAAGYVAKDSPPENIREALRHAIRGERYVSQWLAEKLILGKMGAGKKQPHERLSEREYAVMRQLSRGDALTVIAETLHLSPKTVTTYRARILEKMGMSNNADLTRYIVEHKLD